jgi:hypothetical protein
MRIRLSSFGLLLLLALCVRPVNAQLIANPSPLDFGEVVLTEILDDQLVLENTGSTDILVTNFYLTTPGNARDNEFEILSPTFKTFSMAPADKRTIVIRFAPDFEGLRTRTLLVETDQGEFRFAIQGTGKITHPDLILSANNINFGQVSIGGQKTQVIDIKNIGEELAKISDVSVANFSGIEHFSAEPEDASKPFPVILAQGESMKLRVTFDGAAPIGFKGGRITLVGSVAGQTVIDLAGEVVEADIIITPDPIDFGDVPVGVPVTKTVTLMAVGADPIEIDYINDFSAPFSYVAPPPVPLVLTPGVPYDIQIRLLADAPGPIVSQLQLISDDFSGGGFRGVEIRANGLTPVRVASSEDFSFYCGSKKRIKRTASIENNAASAISVERYTASPGVNVLTSIPLQVPANGNALIEYEFDPQASGTPRDLIFEYFDISSVLVRDTVKVTPVTAVIGSPQTSDIEFGSVAVASSFNFSDFEVKDLEYQIHLSDPDVFELIKDSITLNSALLPNATFEFTDIGAGYYHLQIVAVQPIVFDPSLPLSDQPIFTYRPRYFVARESKADVDVVLTNSDLCASLISDTTTLSTFEICGQQYLIDALSESSISSIALFPNPVNLPELSVRFESKTSGNVTLTVLNADGVEQLRQDFAMVAGSNLLQLQTSALVNGIYWLQITSQDPQFSRQIKFVVER